MKAPGFAATLLALMNSAPESELGRNAKVLIVSDLHAGDGTDSDDFGVNEALFLDALESLYIRDGWTVVLNGDIENIRKSKYHKIVSAHAGLYERPSRLSCGGRLCKILGNHDLGLLKRDDSPFPLHHALLLRHGEDRVVCFHGHQAPKILSRHERISEFVVRFIAHPLLLRDRWHSRALPLQLGKRHGSGGFPAIDIEGEDIFLVECSRPGMPGESAEREALSRFAMPGLYATRYALRKERLGVVFSKIRLLGAEEDGARPGASFPQAST
jgi:hypothetical protein